MESENIENRIAILVYLPDEISLAVKRVKEEVGVSYPNHETQTPHITIYSCRFDEQKFEELAKQITDLNLEPFSIKLGEVEITKLNKGSENLFASIGFQNERPLLDLHEKILPVANALRGSLVRAKDIERFSKGIYSQELFAFIEKYGYEHVRENFYPHITLGEIINGDEQKIDYLKQSLNSFSGKEVVIDKIHLLLSTRRIPSEEKVKESEVFEVVLKA